ncbi:MAG: hypothetical protein IPK50_20525 [Fibrobacterota bacterium]|nr:hypothetical protein [Fibrobacterota bacterium]QQS04640.1 MAG: hypothetical protein IPK50_20525 [Fibrobacterota bacterium]
MIAAAILVTLWGFDDAPLASWAESQTLGACSRNAGACLVRSSWEIVRLDLATHGTDPAVAGVTGLDRSLVGRDFPLLRTWDSLRGMEILLGNETGDQVLQELSTGGSSENSNPATCARLEGSIGSWRGFARLEQVDHYSDATLSEHSGLLGQPRLSRPSPWKRYAWFGENLPPYSLAGAGARWQHGKDWTGVSFLDGWIWQHLPLSDRLVAWEIQQVDLDVRRSGFRWEQSARSLDRMDQPGKDRIMSGLAGWQIWEDRLEGGLTWRLEESWGPGGVSHPAELAARARHSLARGRMSWTGCHLAGNDRFLLQDTLILSDTADGAPWKIGANAEWTDQPDNFRSQTEGNLVGRAFPLPSTPRQTYELTGKFEYPFGRLDLMVETSPWMVLAPRAFALDSATTEGRFGSVRVLRGVLYGWTHGASLGARGSRWESHAGLRHAFQSGAPAPLMDFQPPEWQAYLHAQAGTPFGLSGSSRLSWQSRSLVRNLVQGEWSAPPRWTLDLWLRQELGRSGLSCKAALLDLAASDQPDLPAGGQRRPRLLAALDWNP